MSFQPEMLCLRLARMPTPAFDVTPPPPPAAAPPPPIGTPPPPPPCGRNGGVPQPPAAPPGIGPPPVPPNTGTAPMPSKPPSPPSIPPLPPGPAPPPANVTFWPVNMYISVAATRDVTTSLMAVRSAVLRELPMAFHTDCDLVRSASNTPPACCLSESKICRLCVAHQLRRAVGGVLARRPDRGVVGLVALVADLLALAGQLRDPRLDLVGLVAAAA